VGGRAAAPAPNGVVVRVEANGICRSDWHVWTGDWTWFGFEPKFPHVGGHEFCGIVEEVGGEVWVVGTGRIAGGGCDSG